MYNEHQQSSEKRAQFSHSFVGSEIGKGALTTLDASNDIKSGLYHVSGDHQVLTGYHHGQVCLLGKDTQGLHFSLLF
jgi:hypothetical protein